VTYWSAICELKCIGEVLRSGKDSIVESRRDIFCPVVEATRKFSAAEVSSDKRPLGPVAATCSKKAAGEVGNVSRAAARRLSCVWDGTIQHPGGHPVA
jgi:hypothetical protein